MWASRNVKNKGFTIVELLIVIVVIAILAAITIVAFNGIQSRANTTTVRADLSTVAKQMEIYRADNGSFPAASDPVLANVGMKISKTAYDASISGENFYYCRDSTADRYAIVVRTKDNELYKYDSAAGSVQTYVGAWGSANICTVVGMTSSSRAVGRTDSSGWKYWL